MEVSVQKHDVSDLPKKSRSVDLKNRYVEKSRGSAGKSFAEKEGLGAGEDSKILKRKHQSPYESSGSVTGESRRKSSRKEISLGSFEPVIKRRRKGFSASRPKPNVSVSGVGKQEKPSSLTVASHSSSNGFNSSQNAGSGFALAPSKTKDHQAPSIGNSDNSNGLGGNVVIPKRPRGISRQGKPGSSISSRRAKTNSTCSDKSSAKTQMHELHVNIVSPSQLSNSKRKKRLNDVKEKGTDIDSSVRHIKSENGSFIHVTSRKARRKESSIMVKQVYCENKVPLGGDDEKFYGNFQDDDEENLEQNAARMLSSRFDPRCTRFSGNGMSSSSKPANGSLFLQSVRGNFMGSRPESSSVDAAGRVLRPRKRNGIGFFRKRRHFHEVCRRDVDPYCILNQRIRVFWPLDKNWYSGLVKDYDPVTRLHHVKYDDRDEEWIDLQNERFKLLLFPSEVTSKFNAEKSQLELKQEDEEGNRNATGEDCLGNFMESEPIISWLAWSNHRRKSFPTNIMKKQRRTRLLKQLEPSILLEPKGHTAVIPSSRTSNNLFSKCIAPEGSIDGDITEMSVLQRRTSSDEKRLSFVYFRKRFRNRSEGVTLEKDLVRGNSSGSISILASVAGRAAALEELNIITTTMPIELKRFTLKLSLQPQCIRDLAFGGERFWLCRALYLLQYGKLMHICPAVHMEIVIVDNVLGLRILLFEGSLRWMVALVCLIITTFCQHNEQNNFTALQMPFMSIGLHLSSLHDQRGQLHFVLYSFLELASSKWRYLEDKLKHQCLTMRELPIVDCTDSNIKNLQSKSGQILRKSFNKNPVSLEVFAERSYSDIIHQFIPNKSVYLNMNPALCYIDEKYGRLPPSSLCFATAPSFLLSLHLKLLIENNAASVRVQKPISISSQDCPDNHGKLTINGFSLVEDHSHQVSNITIENLGSSQGKVAANSGKPAVSHMKVETDALSLSNDGELMRSSHDFLSSEVNIIGNSVGNRGLEKNETDETLVPLERFPCHTGSWIGVEKSRSSFHEGSSPSKPDCWYNSFGQLEEQSFDKGTRTDQSASTDLVWEVNERVIHMPNPTAPRSICRRNRHSSVSPSFGHHKKLCQEDFMRNCFASVSRKPRTHVSYLLPLGGYDFGSKPQSHQRKARLYKRIRTDNSKSVPGGSESPRSCHKPLVCDANVLVIVGDRGWRECGVQVVFDSNDQKDWRICVKFSGVTKYVHKPQHLLQPGTTNRYTHAIMWKGGNDWTLEFTHRSQWSLFKQIYEECYNRNIRSVYTKNIPIPGVCQIADDGDSIVEVPFIRSSSMYYQHVGTEVDMALDPSHVLYDMDSDDEEWISERRNSLDTKGGKMYVITDDMFERAMDMFEKFAYAQQCDEFSSDETEEFMTDVGPLDIIKAIYEYWRLKRQKKGLPMIRQFQPALWEYYQQQLKEWESAMSKMHSSPYGCQEKACSIKKPPMFAFCLRPRGLEISNKGTKQKHHKKFMFIGNHNIFAREQDGYHTYGRKLNGLSIEEEKAIVAIPSNESSDSYLWLQSPSSFSPRDAARTGILTMNSDGSDRCQHPKLHRNNAKKGMFPSPRNSQMTPFSYNTNLKTNGVNSWSAADLYEWPSTMQSQSNGLRRHRSDIDEFRLRDASSAAQHASNMAKLKRERTQWLLHKADLALHKATVALMAAEAIKESENDLIGDG